MKIWYSTVVSNLVYGVVVDLLSSWFCSILFTTPDVILHSLSLY